MQEQELVKKLKHGDQQAFNILVEEYKDRVYNACLGFLHNRHDAEDVAQEVFIEVYESIDSFREEAALSTWLYRISVNKSLELIRKRKRKKRWAFFRSMLNADEDPDQYEDREYFDHPGVALEQKERTELLMKAIDSLPENQRTALTLHKFEGLKYKEIADVMKTSLSAVESLIFRAKRNLEKYLYSYFNDQL